MQLFGIVLAAGQGKRMKSKLYKVLHPVCGKPMVGHVVDTLAKLGADRTICVVGHGAEAVRAYIGDRAEFALQAEQLGTGHAVMQVAPLLQNEDGITIVAYGDTPLIKEESLQRMVEMHREAGAAVTLLTADFAEPGNLGRIIRDGSGEVIGIVEAKDCTPEQLAIKEINAGTYCFDNRKLFAALAQVNNDNSQNEYYLTDVIEILRREGHRVVGYKTDDPAEAIGVNDRVNLAEAEQNMRERILRRHMLNGVTIVDPASTYIEADVVIGPDTTILPGCLLRGKTVIGADCEIGPYSELIDSRIADGASVRQSVLTEAEVGRGTAVGPFAYLRPGAVIGENVKIGDFVEIKNARIGNGSKVSHLSYVGDAQVGRNVNIGCGVVTVNYDGYAKHRTVVEDEAFIGSNVNLIAPIKIGRRAYVVAGSTVTQDVGDDDVAIARERQVNKPGYAEKLRSRLLGRNKREQ